MSDILEKNKPALLAAPTLYITPFPNTCINQSGWTGAYRIVPNFSTQVLSTVVGSTCQSNQTTTDRPWVRVVAISWNAHGFLYLQKLTFIGKPDSEMGDGRFIGYPLSLRRVVAGPARFRNWSGDNDRWMTEALAGWLADCGCGYLNLSHILWKLKQHFPTQRLSINVS